MARMLAKKLENGTVRCLACNRYCAIAEGNAGFCGVRANEKGKLRLLVHSKPGAVWVDPVEKKPMFHFLPGTTSFSLGTYGCNFSCSFCQNWDLSQAPGEARAKDPARWMNYFRGSGRQMRGLASRACSVRGIEVRLQVHLVHIQRANHIHRIRLRRDEAGEEGRAQGRLCHQRL